LVLLLAVVVVVTMMMKSVDAMKKQHRHNTRATPEQLRGSGGNFSQNAVFTAW
jgi:hypothetical protein